MEWIKMNDEISNKKIRGPVLSPFLYIIFMLGLLGEGGAAELLFRLPLHPKEKERDGQRRGGEASQLGLDRFHPIDFDF